MKNDKCRMTNVELRNSIHFIKSHSDNSDFLPQNLPSAVSLSAKLFAQGFNFPTSDFLNFSTVLPLCAMPFALCFILLDFPIDSRGIVQRSAERRRVRLPTSSIFLLTSFFCLPSSDYTTCRSLHRAIPEISITGAMAVIIGFKLSNSPRWTITWSPK